MNLRVRKPYIFLKEILKSPEVLLLVGKGTRKLVDNARVNLGMSRGNAQIGTYMNVISYDLSGLLLWKNRRLEFDDRKNPRRK